MLAPTALSRSLALLSEGRLLPRRRKVQGAHVTHVPAEELL
jgi:hypothetical protein